MAFNKTTTQDIVLLLIRLWLGIMMIKSGNCVIDILSTQEERDFFEKWFGQELHFPFPVFMAILAKGSEFIGGILLVLGVFPRIAAAFIAFTMLVATLSANLGENFNIDGGFTISYCLFALVILVWGGGSYSLNRFLPARLQGK